VHAALRGERHVSQALGATDATERRL